MPAYSFQDVQATLAGPPAAAINLGYGAATSDEGITVAMNEAKNTMLTGADGEGMHSLHASKAGTITVRLLKISPINAQLMALYAAQTTDASLWGQNIITVREVKSGDTFIAREGAFQKQPDVSYKKDGDIIEWVFDCIKIDGLLGVY